MDVLKSRACTAFAGDEMIASGGPADVLRPCKELFESGDERILLVFDDATAEMIELDLRGSMEDVLGRAAQDPAPRCHGRRSAAEDTGNQAPRKPGRPRLGVVGREVTLLPRHWEWLSVQPGGASVALRKLVDQARRVNRSKDRIRGAQEVAYRFMSAMTGNYPGFEEATRALFAGDRSRFEEHTSSWPPDVRDYAYSLASGAFPEESGMDEKHGE